MWGADEDADLRQSWGSFVLIRDLHLGCDGKRASWEVYHPNFLARQLGYLQGCPVPLLSSRTILSRGREPRSSEKECNTAVREFQEQCQKFPPRPATPETLCTDTFGDWWEDYTQEFFGAPIECVLNKLFGERPKKPWPPKLKSAIEKSGDCWSAVLNKRLRQEAEPAVEPPPPAKRVKKLAKKGAREIHVISSQTTGATTPSVSPSSAVGQPLVEKQPTPAAETVEVRPVSGAGTPVVPPPSRAVSATEGTSPVNLKSPVNPKPSVFVLEESKESDEAPLANHPNTRRQPPPMFGMAVQAGPSTTDRGKRPVEEPTSVVEPSAPSQDQDVLPSSEAVIPVGPSTADRGKRPAEELEATMKTLVHPQDQDLHIPPQEATSAFWPSNVDNLHRSRELRSSLRHWARPLSSLGSSNDPGDMAEVSSRQASWEVEFKALLSSITAGSGPSAATTEAADSTALTQLREVLSLSASQVLERNGLDLLGACLNDLGADGRLSGDAIVRASSALERVRETFSIFQTALKAEQDLQAATTVQDNLRPKIDALKAK
ncbi:unnamed protein product [Malus baccata var. baccata]